MKRTRVLMADDHNLVLEAFKHLIEEEFEVVGTVSNGRDLLEAAAQLKPDVIVLDISMPMLNGLDAGRQLKKLQPSVKLVYLTMDQDADLAVQAFRLGASGYLLKNSAASELSKAIRVAAVGRSYVTPLATQGIAGSSFLHTPPRYCKNSYQMTSRQREVIQLLAEGRSMKEVASILDITPRTVAFHKYTVMDQQQLKTNSELVQFAIKQHLVAV